MDIILGNSGQQLLLAQVVAARMSNGRLLKKLPTIYSLTQAILKVSRQGLEPRTR